MLYLNDSQRKEMIELVNELYDMDLAKALKDGMSFNSWLEENEAFMRDELDVRNITWGATKICINLDNFEDWIIKIGFDMRADNDFMDYDGDYCDLEYRNYNEAKKRGIEYFFAQTELLYNKDGKNVYIQQKLIPCSDEISDRWYDNIEESLLEYGTICAEEKGTSEYYDAIDNELSELDDYDRVHILFGQDKGFYKLEDFIDDYGINDLHSENYARDEYGDLFIIDFSGYF